MREEYVHLMDFDWATLIAGILGSAATLTGLLFAGRQIKQQVQEHQSAERWRRTEFAAALLERLSSDEDLAFCARAIDWGVGPLLLPQKYRSLFPLGTVKCDHDWKQFAEAVTIQLGPRWNEPEQLTYRYCFDSFAAYLETVQRHIELRNVELSHLIGLRYYLDCVFDAAYYATVPESQRLPGVTTRSVFRPFLEHYYPEAWALVENRHTLPGRK